MVWRFSDVKQKVDQYIENKKQGISDYFQERIELIGERWGIWKNHVHDRYQSIVVQRKQSFFVLWQLILRSIPGFFILLFITRSIGFTLILMAIFVLVRFYHIKQQNPFMTVKSRFFPEDLSRSQYYLFVTFYVLGATSKSKGRVTRDDIEYAEELMNQFQVDFSTRNNLMKIFKQGRDGVYRIDEVILEFCGFFAQRGQSLHYFFEYQLNAAMQDGKLQSEEEQILKTIAIHMGMSQSTFTQKVKRAQAIYRAKEFYSYYQQESFYQRNGSYQRQNSSSRDNSNQRYSKESQHNYQYQFHQSPLQDAYDILEVKETDNFDVVKKSYRRLIKQYHPDKFISQDVPEAVKEESKRKSQEIIGAYDLICKTKGWK